MSKELVISANRHETRVALIEDDQLVEVYFQRANEYSLAGSIHKGRVTRVLPGMQSAFVDLGLERDTFLYVSDFLEEHEDFDQITGDERPPREREFTRERRPPQPPPLPGAEAAPAPAIEAGVPAERPSERPQGERPGDDRGDRRGRRPAGAAIAGAGSRIRSTPLKVHCRPPNPLRRPSPKPRKQVQGRPPGSFFPENR